MRINIIAVGKRMPAWVDAAVSEYVKRMPAHCRLEIVEVPAGKRGKGTDIARVLKREAEQLLQAVPRDDHVIALERTGQQKSTLEMANKIERGLAEGTNISFLIGGPEGLDPICLDRVAEIWSLSKLTLAHPVARVVLAEQIYRAWSVVNHLPYHR